MPRFEATNLQRGHKHFTLVHYGVPVTYETDGFVEKNKDNIPRGASKLLKSSSKDFVKFLGMMMDNSAEASGGASDLDSPRASAKKIQPFSFLPQSSLIRLQLILLWNRRRGGHLHLLLSFIVLASLHFALLCGCLAPTLAGSL
jgi:myosin heavy subunit